MTRTGPTCLLPTSRKRAQPHAVHRGIPVACSASSRFSLGAVGHLRLDLSALEDALPGVFRWNEAGPPFQVLVRLPSASPPDRRIPLLLAFSGLFTLFTPLFVQQPSKRRPGTSVTRPYPFLLVIPVWVPSFDPRAVSAPSVPSGLISAGPSSFGARRNLSSSLWTVPCRLTSKRPRSLVGVLSAVLRL